jgi:hypothetical protein
MRRLTALPLWLEITLALICKALLLWLLWSAFFSAPQTRKMRMPTPQVEQHLLSAAASVSPPRRENPNDAR